MRKQFFREAEDAAVAYRPLAVVRPKANSVLIGGGWAEDRWGNGENGRWGDDLY